VSQTLFSAKKQDEATSLLTEIRVAGYPVPQIKGISKKKFSAIKKLTRDLGKKILTANLKDEDVEELAKASHTFDAAINRLWNFDDKFPAVNFACQLLQYYTITSDQDFRKNLTTLEFCNYLEINSEKFGDCNDNIFIAEYKLIKIYNDLTHFTDAVRSGVTPIGDLEKQLQCISQELNFLAEKIKNWESAAPDSLFFQYLSFARYYITAKTVEFQYTVQESLLTPDEKNYCVASQQACLRFALQKLNDINELLKDTEEHGIEAASGMEFSLGRNVLRHLPSDNIEEIRAHVTSLSR